MATAGDRGVPYIMEYGSSLAGQMLSQVGERVQAFLAVTTQNRSLGL